MKVKSKNPARYDASADVLYLVSKKGEVARSEEVSPGITVEYDARDKIVGVEILRASKVLAKVVASLHAKVSGVSDQEKLANRKSKHKRVL